MNTLLSIAQAAKKLSLSVQQVRTYCRTGRIPAQRVGRSWVISADSLAALEKLSAQDHPSASKGKSGKPLALSFFSGAMGLDIGLEKAGFDVRLACEIDKACRQTIQLNKPDIALLGDIHALSASQILEAVGLSLGDEVDLMIGGPPCQTFSTAGNRQGFKDRRGNLLLTFIDRALQIKPKFLVIENVRGLLSSPLKHRPHDRRGPKHPKLKPEELPGGALFSILKRLQSAGYGVSFNLYNAANFGSPQNRERVILVCSRDGSKMPYLTPTHSKGGEHGLPKWRTFSDAVEGLPKTCTHIRFPENRLKYYRMLKSGQYWKHLPAALQKEALGKSYYSGGGKTGFLRRLDWNKPSPTLVTHPAMPATDLAHPKFDRPLSIEEYKRVQEFPDDWKLAGNLIDQYRQVGNAVPSSLGKAIGKLILAGLAGKAKNAYPNFEYSRYKNTDDVSWLAFYRSQSTL